MAINSTNINKLNNHLSIKKRDHDTPYMTVEI